PGDEDLPRIGIATLREAFDHVIDARGRGAQRALRDLRGVRGEMAVLQTREVTLQRPVRLLHPRFPLYVCPWGDGRYMVGATVLETNDDGPVTARSTVELLNAAYAVHPGFAEARVDELGAGVRPSFADNTPRIELDGTVVRVNGVYRHGFLTAPVLARLVCRQLADGDAHA
ncbi:MAG: FAD-dependent oxidoreductase, partial [Pseudomonadota bacterium]